MRWRDMLGLAAAYAVGYSGFLVLPLLVDTLVHAFGVPLWSAGLIAALHLAGMLAGSLALFFWPRTAHRRHAIGLMLALGACGFALSVVSPGPVVVGAALLLAGLGLGATVGAVNLLAGRAKAPEAMFAKLTLALVLLAILMFMLAPVLSGLLGARAILMLLTAVTAMATAIVLVAGAAADEGAAGDTVASVASVQPPPAALAPRLSGRTIASLLLIVFIYIGQNGAWSFVSVSASSSGIAAGTLATIMSGSAMANLLAPILAGRVAGRGRARSAVIGGGVLLMLSVAALFLQLPVWLFALAVVGTTASMLFLLPFLMGRLIGIDATGRAPAIAPGAIIFGAMLGPMMAGPAASLFGLRAVGLVMLVPIALALLIFLALGKDQSSSAAVA